MPPKSSTIQVEGANIDVEWFFDNEGLKGALQRRYGKICFRTIHSHDMAACTYLHVKPEYDSRVKGLISNATSVAAPRRVPMQAPQKHFCVKVQGALIDPKWLVDNVGLKAVAARGNTGKLCNRRDTHDAQECNFLHVKPEHNAHVQGLVATAASVAVPGKHAPPIDLPVPSVPTVQDEAFLSFLSDSPASFAKRCDILLPWLARGFTDPRFLQFLLTSIESPVTGGNTDDQSKLAALLEGTKLWLQRFGQNIADAVKGLPGGDERDAAEAACASIVSLLFSRINVLAAFVDKMKQFATAFINANDARPVQASWARVLDSIAAKEAEAAPSASGANANSKRRRPVPDYRDDASGPISDMSILLSDSSGEPQTLDHHQAIVVDRTIPIEHGPLHLKQLFRLLHADYSHSLEKAVDLMRTTLRDTLRDDVRRAGDPAKLLTPAKARLHADVYQKLRAADKDRICRLYNRLTFQGTSLQRNASGLMMELILDTSQFDDPSSLTNGKRLMHGNLLVLSRTWFTDPHEVLWYGVIHREIRRSNDGNVQTGENEHFIKIQLELATADDAKLLALIEESNGRASLWFQALESQAFFTQYQRVLESLQAVSTLPSLPLAKELLMGETYTTPQYLNSKSLVLSNALVMRSIVGGAASVVSFAVGIDDLASLVEPWTIDEENRLKAEAKGLQMRHVVDDTQAKALQHIFTHRVAVVQGTPGTGKTFIGGKFVQILLQNDVNCGPILCLAQTNHAIDAVLEDVLPHTQNFLHGVVRLGSRSKNEKIAQFNFSDLRRNFPRPPCPGYRELEIARSDFKDAEEMLRKLQRLSRLQPNQVKQADVAPVEGILERLEVCPEVDLLLAEKRALLKKNYEVSRDCNLVQQELRRVRDVGSHTSQDIRYELDSWKHSTETMEKLIDGFRSALSQFQAFDDDDTEALHNIIRNLPVVEASSYAIMQPAQYKQIAETSHQYVDEAINCIHAARVDLSDDVKSLREDLNKMKPEAKNVAEAAALKNDIKETEDAVVRYNALEVQLKNFLKCFKTQLQSIPKFPYAALESMLPRVQEYEALQASADELRRTKQQLETELSQLTLLRWRVTAPGPGLSSQDRFDITEEVRSAFFGGRPQRQMTSALPQGGTAAAVDAADELAVERDLRVSDRFAAMNDSDSDFGSDSDFESGGLVFATAKSPLELFTQYARSLSPAQDSAAKRERLFQAVIALRMAEVAESMRNSLIIVAKGRKRLEAADARHHTSVLQHFRVIGATTTGCAGMLKAMQILRPKVILVEEAAEVLESHIVACLSEGVEHLILIGDHKQLEPKCEEMALARKNMTVSLMERLVRLGAPYVTLTTQRRMHPDISQLHKQYYLDADTERHETPATVEDHPSTKLIPAPRGVLGETRVLFIRHDGAEGTDKCEKEDLNLRSTFNKFESELACAVAQFLQVANPECSITILLPYVAHTLHTIKFAASKKLAYRTGSAPLSEKVRGIRIASIDDYQGEEDDFVLLCLTRTTAAGFQRGFLNKQNRACVALSRARRGLYVIGCETALEQSLNPLWLQMLQHLRTGSTPTSPLILDRFPGACPSHESADRLEFASWAEMESVHCSQMCNEKLQKCNHRCQKTCHFGNADHSRCAVPCERTGLLCNPPRPAHCSHRCDNKCHEACGKCLVEVDVECRYCGNEVKWTCSRLNPSGFLDCCSAPLKDIGDCGHEIEATCQQWFEQKAQIRCKALCNTKMPCTHVCPKKCHWAPNSNHEKEMKRCVEPKTVPHPVCGTHPITVKCNTDAKSYPPCEHPCRGKAPCGHPCTRKCGECVSAGRSEAHYCDLKTPRTLKPCGHTAEDVRCCDPDPPCLVSCTFKLPCGDPCPGSCGECHGSRLALDHKPCRGKCGKRLLCGHACQGSCSHEVCPPCESLCGFDCGHGAACNAALAAGAEGHRCGSCVARQCQNPCLWACPHVKCTKRCFEVCDRPPCDAPCPVVAQRPCGHTAPCVGVCGEKCPDFCVECFRAMGRSYPQYSKFKHLGLLLNDDVEADCCLRGDLSFLNDSGSGVPIHAFRLVQLPCCDALMLSGEVDEWIVQQTRREGGLERIDGPLICVCEEPLFASSYRPQSALITARWMQINQILRLQMNSYQRQQANESASVSSIVGSLLGEIVVSSEQLAGCLSQFESAHSGPPPPRPSQAKKNKNHKARLAAWKQALRRRNTAQEATTDNLVRLCGANLNPRDEQQAVLEALLKNYATFLSFGERGEELRVAAAVLGAMRALQHHVASRCCAVNGTAAEALSGIQSKLLSRPCDKSDMLIALSAQLRVLAEHETNARLTDDCEGSPRHVKRTIQSSSEPWNSICSALEDGAGAFFMSHSQFFRGKGRGRFLSNGCLQRSCSSFQRFASGLTSPAELLTANGTLDPNKVIFGFHGTAAEALDPIQCRGFDVTRRAGQAYGPGEYFAEEPTISEGYARTSESVLICALLQEHVAKAAKGGILVVNNPVHEPGKAYVIPVGVATWSLQNRGHRCQYPAGPEALRALSSTLDVLLNRTAVRHDETKAFLRQALHECRLQVPRSVDMLLDGGTSTREWISFSQPWFACSNGHQPTREEKCPECSTEGMAEG